MKILELANRKSKVLLIGHCSTFHFQIKIENLEREGGRVEIRAIAENDDGQVIHRESFDDVAKPGRDSAMPHARMSRRVSRASARPASVQLREVRDWPKRHPTLRDP
jgi:hypothetical protein